MKNTSTAHANIFLISFEYSNMNYMSLFNNDLHFHISVYIYIYLYIYNIYIYIIYIYNKCSILHVNPSRFGISPWAPLPGDVRCYSTRPSEARRGLLSRLNFRCGCQACRRSTAEGGARSDEQREELGTLTRRLGGWWLDGWGCCQVLKARGVGFFFATAIGVFCYSGLVCPLVADAENNRYLGSLDFTKAFDHVRPTKIALALRYHGAPRSFVDALMSIWLRQRRVLAWHGVVSPQVQHVDSSIPQGDPWSVFAMGLLLRLPSLALQRVEPDLRLLFFVDDRSWSCSSPEACRHTFDFWLDHSAWLGLRENFTKAQFFHPTRAGRDRLGRCRLSASSGITVLGVHITDCNLRRNTSVKEKKRLCKGVLLRLSVGIFLVTSRANLLLVPWPVALLLLGVGCSGLRPIRTSRSLIAPFGLPSASSGALRPVGAVVAWSWLAWVPLWVSSFLLFAALRASSWADASWLEQVVRCCCPPT